MRLLPLLLVAACIVAHAAFGQTQQDYQAQAIARHPELKIPTSPLSKAMAEELVQLRKEKSDILNAADWPLRVADALALILPPHYTLVEQWTEVTSHEKSISGRDKLMVKVILIDPKEVSRERLLKLVGTFRGGLEKGGSLSVIVCDDPKAARLPGKQRMTNKLSDADTQLLTQHRVAVYNRDSHGVGLQWLRMHLPGPNGPVDTEESFH